MCGICGVIGRPLLKTKKRVQRMMDRMPHRGPDGNGLWQAKDGSVTLGHVRLAIVDTSDAGCQPMHLSTGIHSIVNGEFYNYPNLRQELEKMSEFKSHCDSEIILHGYQAYGVDFLRKLNGMFALAIFDERNDTLILARDRIGIKPLYYTIYNGEILFASEIKALFGAIEESSWLINPQGLSEYMTYQSPLGENTLFNGINQVLPGHMIRINTKELTTTKQEAYWTAVVKADSTMTFDDAVSQFDTVFNNSIERHLLSDVPVASYLSAGFDSSSVFAKATEKSNLNGGDKLVAYTGNFSGGDSWYDETLPAKELVKIMGSSHKVVNITPSLFTSHLDDVVDALDEPRMGMGAFSQYMVAKAASQDYKVILAGHGGDELFSGYPVFSYAENGVLGFSNLSELSHFGYFFLSDLNSSFIKESGRKLPTLWSVRDQSRIVGLEMSNLKPWQQIDSWTKSAQSSTDGTMLTYLNAYLPGLLVVEDKISMAHSLESRTPLLDNEMIDFSLSIPASVKLNGGELKAIIKSYAKDTLPKTYFEQPKKGFPTPLRHWLRNDLTNLVSKRLTDGNSHLCEVFNPLEIQKFINEYQTSWKQHLRPFDEIQTHKMWQLLSLESWMRTWYEKYGITLRLR